MIGIIFREDYRTTHDIKVAPELLSKIPLDATDYISADKGYDSESFREIIINQ